MLGANFLPAAAACALVGYLLGSLSFAILVSRWMFGKDIRQFGSGNAGMTNILRTFGKGAAIAVLLGDFLKGVAGVLVGRYIFSLMGVTGADGGYIAGLFAILGHLFPLYFGFKGGKGVLTSCGVILMLNPYVLLALLLPLLPVLFIVKIVSLISIIGAVLYPFVTYGVLALQNKPALYDALFAVPISILIIYMHRENIKRLRAGTEHRFGSKKTPPSGDNEAK